MKKTLAVLFVVASVFSDTAQAALPAQVDPVKQCFDRAQDQEQQARCYDQAITAQKKRLTAAYNKLVAYRKNANDLEGVAALNQLQKNWISWRDQTFNFLNYHVAGEGQTVFSVSHDFLLDAVTKQADLLETIHAMEGGE
ncbi:lysozyme inhibitor LprI family protein [Burkholderia gladioli]|uniref:lysozyme inhibitor LprI family protein n=1 Tax=Burkholderia gladioli TaxID=28095 RepID=UPI00163E4D34|nr:lysozyme inhibitor LprI family protein [Burkholderia gladioli]